MKHIRTIAGLTWREALRRKILVAALVLGGAFLALYGVGLFYVATEAPRNMLIRRAIGNMYLVMGLYAVNWLTVMMTILVSVDTLAGEIASGTIQAVLAKPVRRWEVVLGKWIGLAGMLTMFLLVMAAGVVAQASVYAGHPPPNLARALGLMWLESMLLLALTFRIGASLSTLTTGVAVFSLHATAFMAGMVEEIGALWKSQTAVNVGILTSLVIPSESMWRRAASDLQGPVIGGFGQSPFTTSSVPSGWMALYAAVYAAVALALAVRRFSQRDL
jgi:Cu-processing system permease protein